LQPALFTANALAIGGSLQCGVVHQKHHIVSTEFGVAFKHAIAVFSAFAKCSQCVLGRQSASAPVGNPSWIGPIFERLSSIQSHKRFPVSALKW
jgi:hypothetical protein